MPRVTTYLLLGGQAIWRFKENKLDSIEDYGTKCMTTFATPAEEQAFLRGVMTGLNRDDCLVLTKEQYDSIPAF